MNLCIHWDRLLFTVFIPTMLGSVVCAALWLTRWDNGMPTPWWMRLWATLGGSFLMAVPLTKLFLWLFTC